MSRWHIPFWANPFMLLAAATRSFIFCAYSTRCWQLLCHILEMLGDLNRHLIQNRHKTQTHTNAHSLATLQLRRQSVGRANRYINLFILSVFNFCTASKCLDHYARSIPLIILLDSFIEHFDGIRIAIGSLTTK